MENLHMKNKNQLRIKFTLFLSEKEEIEVKKVFYGSLFFIFLSFFGTALIWFCGIYWQKIKIRLKILGQFLASESFSRSTSWVIFFIIFNLSVWGWLNKESIFPIAMGKMEEEIILGARDAVKIDDLQKESIGENSAQNFLGEEKDLNLSLIQERCQRNKLERESSELCGKYEKDEVLERELKKIDDQARAKILARNPAVGKGRCADPKDDPQKSQQGKGKHTDEDCCPDPDEYPDPRCYYTPAGYALMLKR
jgi:hypothetical protein